MTKDNFFYKFNNRYLCPLKKEHLSKLKEWRNAQMKVLRQHKPLTDSHQKKWFAGLKKDKNQALFALMTGIPPKLNFSGYCGITNIDYRNKIGEISFLVNPKRVSQKETYKKDFLAVLNMLCKYSFEELGLNKVFTETFDFRKYHSEILEDFGFCKEGELREQYFDKDKYFNSLIHSVLLSEWKSLKKCNGKIKK